MTLIIQNPWNWFREDKCGQPDVSTYVPRVEAIKALLDTSMCNNTL